MGGTLGYSEPNASRRLQAAEAVRKFPEALSLIKDGSLTICALALIARHLTVENRSRVLKRAEGKSVREVERLVAELAPLPDTRDTIRSLPPPEAPRAIAPPEATHVAVPPAVIVASLRQKIVPRAPKRILFSFTGSEELWRVYERCRDLLWHKFPAGRLEEVFLELGESYLKRRDPALLPPSKPKPPRVSETRSVPRWVRSAVYRRDQGRCAFISAEGRRCEARRGLEYDHIQPWALKGRSDDPGNIRLLCREHNLGAARAAGLT